MEKKLNPVEVNTMIRMININLANVDAQLAVTPDDIQLKAYHAALVNSMCQLNACGITANEV